VVFYGIFRNYSQDLPSQPPSMDFSQDLHRPPPSIVGGSVADLGCLAKNFTEDHVLSTPARTSTGDHLQSTLTKNSTEDHVMSTPARTPIEDHLPSTSVEERRLALEVMDGIDRKWADVKI
jgi:hypothetical protein